MTPDQVKPYEPGMAAHFMDVMGHDFRCSPVKYMDSRPMPNWPGRRPLVVGIPTAVFGVKLEAQEQARALKSWAASFCGGLRLDSVMETDTYLV